MADKVVRKKNLIDCNQQRDTLKKRGNNFMTHKKKIIEILKKYKSLTQREISFHIFGDYKHDSNIYNALMDLDSSGLVVKKGRYPACYEIVDSEPHLDDCSEENETTEIVVNQYVSQVQFFCENKPFEKKTLNLLREMGRGAKILEESVKSVSIITISILEPQIQKMSHFLSSCIIRN